MTPTKMETNSLDRKTLDCTFEFTFKEAPERKRQETTPNRDICLQILLLFEMCSSCRALGCVHSFFLGQQIPGCQICRRNALHSTAR